eukprot:scaffold16898_cov21-Tisochrysis_lutea.AAC.2
MALNPYTSDSCPCSPFGSHVRSHAVGHGPWSEANASSDSDWDNAEDVGDAGQEHQRVSVDMGSTAAQSVAEARSVLDEVVPWVDLTCSSKGSSRGSSSSSSSNTGQPLQPQQQQQQTHQYQQRRWHSSPIPGVRLEDKARIQCGLPVLDSTSWGTWVCVVCGCRHELKVRVELARLPTISAIYVIECDNRCPCRKGVAWPMSACVPWA